MSAAHPRAPAPWLGMLRAYLATILPLMLAWEVAQLPLYTIWQTASWRELAVAVLHCTAGDGLLALVSLGIALLVVGDSGWPRTGFARVATTALVVGVAATAYLEWINVEIRRSWAYAAAMPRLPPFGTGLAPVLQWLCLPLPAMLLARRLGDRRVP